MGIVWRGKPAATPGGQATVSDKAQRTVRIKWVRSAIGFDHHQKRIVRSLGLRKLNQEVERPDTPQIRGLVAKVPHLVEIVEAPTKPAWTLVPEYTIHPPAAAPAKPAEAAGESPAVETGETGTPPPAPLPSRGEESGAGFVPSGPAAGLSAEPGPSASELANPGGEGSGSQAVPASADATGASAAGGQASAKEGQS